MCNMIDARVKSPFDPTLYDFYYKTKQKKMA